MSHVNNRFWSHMSISFSCSNMRRLLLACCAVFAWATAATAAPMPNLHNDDGNSSLQAGYTLVSSTGAFAAADIIDKRTHIQGVTGDAGTPGSTGANGANGMDGLDNTNGTGQVGGVGANGEAGGTGGVGGDGGIAIDASDRSFINHGLITGGIG